MELDERPTDRASRWPLAALLIAALLLRVGWALHQPSDLQSLHRLPDQSEYLDLGRNLLEHHELAFIDTRFGDVVHAFRMPGYPLFVALCDANPTMIRLVQAVLDTSSLLAVYLLARRWCGHGPALLAAAIMAINPYLIYFCGLLLSETVFTAMLIWGVVLLTRSRGRCVSWWGGILLLIASIYVRPSAIALPVALAIAAALVNRHEPGAYHSRWLPPVGSLALLLTILALLPWAWRNRVVMGRWIWTTTNRGITLYDGFNPDADGSSNQSLFLSTLPQLWSMNELQRSDYLSERARQYVSEHPQRLIELTGLKIARTWSPVPLSAEYGSDRKIVMISLAYMIPFYLLVVAGVWFGAAPMSIKLLLLLPALYFTAVHAASVGSLRYRIPADVPMGVLMAMAFEAFRGLRHSVLSAPQSVLSVDG